MTLPKTPSPLDIAESLLKQIHFLHQVSLPHYENPEFQRTALFRYKRFLYLNKVYKAKQQLVPTVDIDLVWRSHQLHPQMYARDCERILGRLLDHEESIKDYAKGLIKLVP